MRGLGLMSVAGIRITIDPSWFVIFFLMVYSLATGYFPTLQPPIEGGQAWILGVVAALLLFASVLVHELSHALLARRFGIDVPRIRLFLFGGVSEMAAEPDDPAAEIRIAAAGPLTSYALAGIFFTLAATGLPARVPGASAIVDYLAILNFSLGTFNLLPGFPLDGGRILRAWLWSRSGNLLRATRAAGRAGSFVGFGLMGAGVLELIGGRNIGGVWFIIIGVFLSQAATASYRLLRLRDALSGIKVGDIMTQPAIAVPDHVSLEELAHDWFFRHPRGSFPVTSGDRFAGMVTLDQLKTVPREEWAATPVRGIMTPADATQALAPGDDGSTALEKMIRGEAGRLPVLDEGRLVGILSRRDVMKLFKIRSDLGA